MRVKWRDLSDGFDWVCAGETFGSDAFISKATGKVIWRGDGMDDIEPAPDDLDDASLYLALPSRRDLELGGRLVKRFAQEIAPDRADEIADVFSRKGAYRRLKDYLSRHGLLERWHAFENAETAKALREWCAENGVEIEAA